ncbi:outer membrane beta-barrel protein [Aquimarina sp. RZ0]|uniref:outer membrane beta-barrel protein n=1 Tax=Aquimarina sp. RZ0 TaxID=2607730 RepID=UPI0011F22844|nr:outer membrane beta-barrel protein [Aquimarina sp. RZ0]KAA1246263.1 PorT family protein [Aquimarina sp. RZ0]
MRKQLLLTFLTLPIFLGYSQIKFEKGYFVLDNGAKTACYIKNIDWKDNPVDFIYKLSLEEETKTASIHEVKEFEITGQSLFKRYKVDIDRSSETISKLSVNIEPEFKKEQLFLKVLVNGDALLFSYEDGNLNRYFYAMGEENPKQLIYKSYRTVSNDRGRNNRYRQQLWTNVRCQEITMNYVENLDYRRNSLIKYFEKYNRCIDPAYSNTQEQTKKDVFNLTINPGVKFSSLSIDNKNNDLRDIDFGSKTNFKLGIELEYVLPFNNNKWSVFMEPTYQSYSAEKFITYFQSSLLTIETNVTVDYTSIELPVGLRHYFFLKEGSLLFVDVGLLMADLRFRSSLDFEDERADISDLDFGSASTFGNIALGVGYKFKGKYSAKLQYEFKRNILAKFTNWSSDYSSLSLNLGYTLF